MSYGCLDPREQRISDMSKGLEKAMQVANREATPWRRRRKKEEEDGTQEEGDRDTMEGKGGEGSSAHPINVRSLLHADRVKRELRGGDKRPLAEGKKDFFARNPSKRTRHGLDSK